MQRLRGHKAAKNKPLKRWLGHLYPRVPQTFYCLMPQQLLYFLHEWPYLLIYIAILLPWIEIWRDGPKTGGHSHSSKTEPAEKVQMSRRVKKFLKTIYRKCFQRHLSLKDHHYKKIKKFYVSWTSIELLSIHTKSKLCHLFQIFPKIHMIVIWCPLSLSYDFI